MRSTRLAPGQRPRGAAPVAHDAVVEGCPRRALPAWSSSSASRRGRAALRAAARTLVRPAIGGQPPGPGMGVRRAARRGAAAPASRSPAPRRAARGCSAPASAATRAARRANNGAAIQQCQRSCLSEAGSGASHRVASAAAIADRGHHPDQLAAARTAPARGGRHPAGVACMTRDEAGSRTTRGSGSGRATRSAAREGIGRSLPVRSSVSGRMLQLRAIAVKRLTKITQVTVVHEDSALSTSSVDNTVHQGLAPRAGTFAASFHARLAKKTPMP